jgi:hypothetical protein
MRDFKATKVTLNFYLFVSFSFRQGRAKPKTIVWVFPGEVGL